MPPPDRYQIGCPHCLSTENHHSCPDCNLVFYCSKEHRDLQRASHEPICKTVIEARSDYEGMESEIPVAPESLLRDHPRRGKVFQDYEDYFTRYTKARVKYAKALEKLHTGQAAQQRIKLLKNALLMRPDDASVHSFLRPLLGLMFRLLDDEKTYNFLKVLTRVLEVKYTKRSGGTRIFDCLTPYSDIEMIRATPCPQTLRVGHVILKLRVIAKLREMRKIEGTTLRLVPPELKNKSHFGFLKDLASTTRHWYTLSENNHVGLLNGLIKQVRWLIVYVNQYNPRIWVYLMAEGSPSGLYGEKDHPVSHALATMTRIHLREAFTSTPGAVEFVKAFLSEGRVLMEPVIKEDPEMEEEVNIDDIPWEKEAEGVMEDIPLEDESKNEDGIDDDWIMLIGLRTMDLTSTA